MFSVEGVKYTTECQVAEDMVDRLLRTIEKQVDLCWTRVTRVGVAGVVDLPRDTRTRRAVRDEMACASPMSSCRGWARTGTRPSRP